jgi:hypothetical protein
MDTGGELSLAFGIVLSSFLFSRIIPLCNGFVMGEVPTPKLVNSHLTSNYENLPDVLDGRMSRSLFHTASTF